jgi:hypothetical protein
LFKKEPEVTVRDGVVTVKQLNRRIAKRRELKTDTVRARSCRPVRLQLEEPEEGVCVSEGDAENSLTAGNGAKENMKKEERVPGHTKIRFKCTSARRVTPGCLGAGASVLLKSLVPRCKHRSAVTLTLIIHRVES